MTRSALEPVKNKGGRSPIINQKIIQDVTSAIKAGNYMEVAAAYAGISKDTFYRWMKRGAREKRRVLKDKRSKIKQGELPYVLFAEGVRKALADAEVRDVSMIAKAASGGQVYTEEKIVYDAQGRVVEKHVVTKKSAPQWQAAAWRLERKYPNKWGRRVAIRKDEGTGEESAEDFAKKMRDEFGALAGILGCGDEAQNDSTADITTGSSDEESAPEAVLPTNK